MRQESNKFVVEIEGSVATLEFKMEADNATSTNDGGRRGQQQVIHLVSTIVPDALSGRGVGSLLAQAAFTYSRDNQLKVRNSCWFLDKYLVENPEFKDMLIKD